MFDEVIIQVGIVEHDDAWCRRKFSDGVNDWSQKAAGNWIIEKCNSKGVFDPSSSDQRSLGVWRDESGNAIAHCGDKVAYPDGRVVPLLEYKSRHVLVGARPIPVPVASPFARDEVKNVLNRIESLWGWKRDGDAEYWLGWVAAASLGGFPDWRAHLYVHGSRGSGKSKLIELAACLLGELAGEVVNDATESGLRQSRNLHARPLLIDEFEPDDSSRNTRRQDSMMALFRRMSGGAGGRISRGGADHKAVSFRTLGAVYVSSINHVHLEPQDRSRFIMLELGALTNGGDLAKTAADLDATVAWCRENSARFRGRMLQQASRWDATHAALASVARKLGADARQADTAATILTGLDLALFDGPVDAFRLNDVEDLIRNLVADAADSGESSEGIEALDHLLGSLLTLDHGLKRTVAELLEGAITGRPMVEVADPRGALARAGIFVLPEKGMVGIRIGRTSETADLFARTKWSNGTHKSALLKLDGAVVPASGVRVKPYGQNRMLLLPFEQLRLELDP